MEEIDNEKEGKRARVSSFVVVVILIIGAVYFWKTSIKPALEQKPEAPEENISQ